MVLLIEFLSRQEENFVVWLEEYITQGADPFDGPAREMFYGKLRRHLYHPESDMYSTYIVK